MADIASDEGPSISGGVEHALPDRVCFPPTRIIRAVNDLGNMAVFQNGIGRPLEIWARISWHSLDSHLYQI